MMAKANKSRGRGPQIPHVANKGSGAPFKKPDDYGSLMGERSTKGPNNITWRTGNTLGTKLAATLPFNWPNGLRLESYDGVNQPSVVPGMMVVYTRLTAGGASGYNDPVNLAFRKIYSFVRHANSGSKNYEAADQALMCIAVGQALGCLGWLQRVYKLMCRFDTVDRYTPKYLVEANGVDYDDVIKHQAELAWLIMWFGKSISSIAVPNMPYFQACYEAFTHLYVDDDSPRHQYYMLSPSNFGVYNPVYTGSGGGVDYTRITCEPNPGRTNLLTYAALFNLVHVIMDVLLSDEDIGIISGDILKAYGESGLFKPSPLTEGNIEAEKSQEILEQIHNLRLSPDSINFDAYQQNPGGAQTAPYVELDVSIDTPTTDNNNWKWIDSFENQPTPEAVVNATVLQVSFSTQAAAGGTREVDLNTLTFDLYYPETFDIIVGIYPNIQVFSFTAQYMDNHVIGTADFTSGGGLVAITNFDWAPFTVFETANGVNHFYGDIRNINGFNINVMRRLHENSTLSLFAFGTGSDVK